MEFHERLKQLRNERKLTQKKLGAALNYGSSAIANYESGRNQPSIPDLKKIAHYFEVSLDYLVGDAEVPSAPQLPLTPDELELVSNILIKKSLALDNEIAFLLRPTIRNILLLYDDYHKKNTNNTPW